MHMIKRPLKHGLCFLAIAVSAVACTCKGKDGDWDPIKTDCREVTVPPQGGSTVVTMKNYKRWWISAIRYETDGEKRTIAGEEFGFEKFGNEWCEIVVPSENPNTLYVALKENRGQKSRKIGIGMTVGDAFTGIEVTQGSALLTTE